VALALARRRAVTLALLVALPLAALALPAVHERILTIR